MASKKATQAFAPYTPPVILRLEAHGHGGPSTPASSLLHRMGRREVDEEVVAVVAWALSNFGMRPSEFITKRMENELLDDLGLEWRENPMGGTYLAPKAPVVQPLPSGKKGAK